MRVAAYAGLTVEADCGRGGPEFASFCSAVRAWLRAVPTLDPALNAAADLLEGEHAARPATEREMVARALDCSDAHAALGARTALDIWHALRCGTDYGR
jgi:hypothetical protein